MQTLKPSDVAQTGEKLVEEWLSENGFINVLINTTDSSSSAIEANGTIENILVHVRTHVQPFRPGRIMEEQRNKIKITAESLGRKAYVAYVVIDADKNIVGEISWERLS
jgi:hypothetical protein